MRKTVEKTIGDKRFQITQMALSDVREVAARLLQLASPVLGPLVGKLKGVDEHIPMEAFGEAITQLAHVAIAADMEYFIKKLSPSTQFELPNGNFVYLHLKGADLEDRTAPNEDFAFDGQLSLQIQWLIESLKVNLADFLGGKAGSGQALGGLMNQVKGFGFPSTSTGTSTESQSARSTSPV